MGAKNLVFINWLLLGILGMFISIMPTVYSQESNLSSVLNNAQKSLESKKTNTPTVYDYAHQNVTMPPFNYSKIFSENKYFQVCYPPLGPGSLLSGGCFPAVDVLYQDGSTVAISSDHIDIIWKAVAELKKSGYKIDEMTSYPLTKFPSDSTTYVNILIVMSR